jgi:hypothetical protein
VLERQARAEVGGQAQRRRYLGGPDPFPSLRPFTRHPATH